MPAGRPIYAPRSGLPGTGIPGGGLSGCGSTIRTGASSGRGGEVGCGSVLGFGDGDGKGEGLGGYSATGGVGDALVNMGGSGVLGIQRDHHNHN